MPTDDQSDRSAPGRETSSNAPDGGDAEHTRLNPAPSELESVAGEPTIEADSGSKQGFRSFIKAHPGLKRLGTFIVSASAVVGAAAGVIAILPDKGPDLSVAAADILTPRQLNPDEINVPDGAQVQVSEEKEQIDVTLRNDGDDTALITEIRVSLDFAEPLEDCLGAGGGVVRG